MELIPKERLFRSENIVYDEKKVWTKLGWFNDILEIDRTTGNARVIPLPKEYDGFIWSHRSLNKKDRTIFVLPFRARELLLFNLDTEEYKNVLLPEGIFAEGETEGFTQSVILEDYLIMFGYYPMILFYNISTGVFSTVDGIRELLDDCFRPAVWFTSWIEHKDTLYAHVPSTNAVVILDTNSRRLSVKQFDRFDHLDGVVGIYNGETVCVEFKDIEMFLLYRNAKGICKEVTLPYGNECGIRPFSWIAIENGRAYMFPGSSLKTICFDLESESITEGPGVPAKSCEEMKEMSKEFPLNYFSYVQMGEKNYGTSDGKLITIHPWTAQLVEIDSGTDTVRLIPVVLNTDSVNRLYYEELKKRDVDGDYYACRDENDSLGGLDGFISFLINNDMSGVD